jgi:hypothetical protein
VGRLCWRVCLGERHDTLGDVRPQRLDARTPRLVAQETVISFLHEALLPAPDTSLRFAGPAHDLIGANTVRTQQDDLSPPDMFVGALRSRASTFRRRRSAGLRVMENPVRMRQPCMRPVRWESPPGFECQTRSTSDKKTRSVGLARSKNIKGIASNSIELESFLPWSESNGPKSPGPEC